MTGFEPVTSSTQNTHATKLRYIPICPMTQYTFKSFLYFEYRKLLITIVDWRFLHIKSIRRRLG